ncbi:MAG: hypothetical protein KA175_08375 [Flavobacteriales bacterium]|nr:hypothetical protein [Flavobacteriales bacterium]MBP6697619.1 hypothetical protein [Flavobacteriales bacterium]
MEHTGASARFSHTAEAPDGSVFSVLTTDTAEFLVKLDPTGDLLWSMHYPANVQDQYWFIDEIEPTADGGALLVHDLDQTSDGLEDWQHAVCTRIDMAGQVVWSKRYSATINAWSNGIWTADVVNHPNGDHTVLLMEWPFAYTSPVLLRINASGDPVWGITQGLGPSGPDRYLMPADGNGTILFTPGDNANGIFRYDDTGALLWGIQVQMTNTVWNYVNMIPLVTPTGEVFLAGNQYDLGSLNYTYLMKVGSAGVLDWYKIFGSGQFGMTLPMYGPAKQLTNGDLVFGSQRRSYFSFTGDHLGSAVQAHPTQVLMNNEYQLIVHPSKYGAQMGSLVSGTYHKTDLTFAYEWSTPTIARIPFDLAGTCGWMIDSTLAEVDTIVPAGMLGVADLPVPQPCAVSVIDTTTIAVPDNLTTYFDFCTLVGFEENNAHYHPELEVFPSPLAAGDPLHLRTSKAAEIMVLDARGRIVWHERVNSSLINVPTSGLASGLHLVQAIDGQGTALGSARFVVE